MALVVVIISSKEINVWSLPGDKERPAREADNTAAICDTII
jgi:hypothetical protein